MRQLSHAEKSALFSFPYLTCRNISAPEDEHAGRKVYSGQAPVSSVLTLEDNENVREYLVDAVGKAKKSPTLVHQAIRKTLHENPDDFSVLNSGMVIVARDIEVDDKGKVITLLKPSIVNGSQTQGELKRFFDEYQGKPEYVPSIKYELIVTDDDALIAEISIARNFQNDVKAISIAGRRGQLDALEAALQETIPDAKLRKSESELVANGDYLDTEKLIQVVFALMPNDLLEKYFSGSDSKVFTYSQKAHCLKLFQRAVEGGKDEMAVPYKYCLDIAGTAWKLYGQWKSHQGFQGCGLRAIVRDGREIVEIPDGIVFPIISSLSEFVKKTNGRWRLAIPGKFDDKELIDTAIQAYKEIARSNPQSMGKDRACYSSLSRVTSIYARLLSEK